MIRTTLAYWMRVKSIWTKSLTNRNYERVTFPIPHKVISYYSMFKVTTGLSTASISPNFHSFESKLDENMAARVVHNEKILPMYQFINSFIFQFYIRYLLRNGFRVPRHNTYTTRILNEIIDSSMFPLLLWDVKVLYF